MIERYGTIGGNLTIGCVGPILGKVAKGTMYDEIRDLLGVQDREHGGNKVQDMEDTKSVLLDFVMKEKSTCICRLPLLMYYMMIIKLRES